ncbi:MAG: site-specific integrase [Actinomycetota bacterium]|nr:site-specific integrase [Actinomycetota bacterium]
MTSENPLPEAMLDPGLTSENTTGPLRPRHGRAPVDLPAASDAVLDDYLRALATAPLSAQTRRTYTSRVRQYLAWLAGAEVDADPLGTTDGRDWAMRDYRTHLQAVAKRSHATVNTALAAIDDFYIRRGLGPGTAAGVGIPVTAPRALDKRAQIRYLRAVEARPSPRDQALALVPFYAGARIAEIVALDVDDIARSAREGMLRIYGKGGRVRQVPIHPKLRRALTGWLTERSGWPGAAESSALSLNKRGQRLSVRGAHDIITGIATSAGLDDDTTAHVLRHIVPAKSSCRDWLMEALSAAGLWLGHPRVVFGGWLRSAAHACHLDVVLLPRFRVLGHRAAAIDPRGDARFDRRRSGVRGRAALTALYDGGESMAA